MAERTEDPRGRRRSVVDRIGRLVNPDSRRVLGLVRSSAPRLLFTLAIDAACLAVLPALVVLALAELVGRSADAAGAGFDSAAGDAVVPALVLVALAFGAAMVVAPLHRVMASVVRVHLTGAMQDELMTIVNQPTGIRHLEDGTVLSSIEVARGSLTTWNPADAPAALAAVWAKRATCVLACGLLSVHVWWLGPVYLVLWTQARRPIMRVIRDHVSALGGNAAVMRRAEYLRSVATRPAAAKELRAFGLTDWIVGRFTATWEEGMAEVWRIRSGVHGVIARVGAAVLLAYGAGAGYVAWAAWQGDLDVRAVAVLLPALALTLTTGAVDFDDITLEWMLIAAPQLDEVRRQVERVHVTLAGSRQPSTTAPTVRFERVGFAYPSAPDRPVFEELSLELPSGSSTAVVGINGAGKTTLVKLLARMHDPTTGTITEDDVDLRDLDPRSWRRRIALVSQEILRLPLTVRENIAAGAVDVDDEDGIRDAAARAGIAAAVERLPDGWDTRLSTAVRGGVDLSTGQWQRIGLARALFAARHGATVLVLDEPTASMDVRAEREFFDRFLDLTTGTTSVIVSHRFSTVRLADQICVLAEGRVAERGSHRSLIDQDGRYRRMFVAQAGQLAPLGGASPVGP